MQAIKFRCNTCGQGYTVSSNLAGKQAKCAKCGSRTQIPASKQVEEIVVATLVEPEAQSVRPLPMATQIKPQTPAGPIQNHYLTGGPSRSNGQAPVTNAWDGLNEWLFRLGRKPSVHWSLLGVSILLCLTIFLMPPGLLFLYHSVKTIIRSHSDEWKRIATYQQAKKKFLENRAYYLAIYMLEYFLVSAVATAIALPFILFAIWALNITQ